MHASQKTLRTLAGALWLGAGAWLVFFGSTMLVRASREEGAGALALSLSVLLGLALGWPKGKYILGQTALRNLARIRRLVEPKIWQFLGLRTTIVILVMIGFGRGLRALADQGLIGGYTVVGGVYIGIGVALLRSSQLYLRAPLPIAPRNPLPTADGPRGILLVNLGTPDAPRTKEVRRYLRQFLSDPFVVELPRPIWWFVLNAIILPFRSPSSARLYRSIWTEAGSPILVHAFALRDALRERLSPDMRVALGMRYGNPSLDSALDELRSEGCREVTVVTLFPQYSRSTTGSVHAEVNRIATLQRDALAIRTLPTDPVDPGYIDACVQRAREAVADKQIDHWVLSFHGIPEAYEQAGDPYGDQCALTARAIAEGLGLSEDAWSLVFQSRFGPDPWLRPYADEYVLDLAKKAPRIAVLVPGFAADCLETIEEIGTELREDFLAQGGEEFILVPALNTHPAWVEALANSIEKQT